MGVLRSLFFIILLMLPQLSLAEVYKWTDAKGQVHFSNKPHQGAERHPMQALSSVNNPFIDLEKMHQEIKYTQKNGSMIVQGHVNGVGMQFVVDTGATFVVIPPAIAKQAHISTRNSKLITLQTANGATQAPLISLPTLHIEKLEQRNVQAVVQVISPDPTLGLLGMSFLGAYHMSIDHKRQIITLEPQP